MKNLFALLFLAGLISFSSCENASEQSAENEVETPAVVEETPAVEEEAPAAEETPAAEGTDTTVAN